MNTLILIWLISCIPLYFWMDTHLFKQKIDFHTKRLIETLVFVGCLCLLYFIAYVVAKLMGWPVLRF